MRQMTIRRGERLFIFAKEYELDNWGNYEKVNVYIKMKIEKLEKEDYSVIISFHPANKPMIFLFK